MSVRATFICGLLLLCLGCGPKVMDEREVSLAVGDIVPIEFGPFKSEEKIKVEASASGGPISIYVHPKDQTEHVDYAISYGKQPPGIIAGSASTQGETLEALIPAGTEVVVRLQTAERQASQVQLKISN